jgi:hypothetical protein
LTIAEQAIPVMNAINSLSLSKAIVAYIRQELIGSFLGDSHIETFVADTHQRLLPTQAISIAGSYNS